MIPFLLFFLSTQDQECTLSVAKILWPLLLLSIYPVVIIPLLIAFIFRDIVVKREGLMAWHRDSIGVLVQRFFFSLIIMSSILTLRGCLNADNSNQLKHCMVHSGVPLIVVLVIVFFKVLCLRKQQYILWTAFIVFFIAQLIILAVCDTKFLIDVSSPGYTQKEKI